MISLTLPTGEAGWLALYPPEMSTAPTLRVKSDTYTDRGATGREGRRPSDPTIGLELDWQAELSGADLTAMRAALVAYQNEPVVMPCWPLAVGGAQYNYGTTPQGGYMIAWMESGSYAFFTGAVTSPASWDWIAPAIYGYFSDIPRAQAAQSDLVRYSFAFVEDSPAVWALGPFNAAPGVTAPAIGGYTPPGFPFDLDWAQEVESGAASVQVTREQVGPNRRSLQTFWPNTAERQVKGQLTAADPWPLICWWHAQSGPAQSQWFSTGLSAGLLSADASAGASSIIVSPQFGIVTGTVLAFSVWSPAGVESVFYIKVASVSGTTVNLSNTLPVQCYTNLTTISTAILGRHISDTLEIVWVSPDNFSAKLDWVELAAEYSIPGGETLGRTIGLKEGRPYLLEISTTQPVAEVLQRITDWSTTVVLSDGRSFTPGQLAVGDRMRGIDLSDQVLQITLPWVTGSPLAHFIPGQAFRRLFAKLYYVPISGAGVVGAAVQDWYGEIVDVEYSGPKMDIQVSGPSKVFDRQVPSDQYCMTCNAHLYDSRCGVDKASWTVSALVTGVSGNIVSIGSASRTGGPMTPLQVVNGLAFGFLQWVDAGVTKSVGVYASSFSVSTYNLTLREPIAIPNGTAVTVIPGCDLQWLGGCLRYTGKFRGFPFVPARAPQFTIPTSQSTSGKK